MTRRKIAFWIASILALGIGFLFLPVRQWFADVEGYVQGLGSMGPLVVALGYTISTVLLIPGSAISIGAGTLFGLKTGFVIVLVGANLGALSAFVLARTLLRRKVAHWMEKYPKCRSLDRAIARQGFRMVFLLRLSPAFPFTLLNYALGLTGVRAGAYVLANLLGMLPGMFLYVYIGATARDALTGWAGESVGDFQQVLKYVGLLATLAMVAMVTYIARNALRDAEHIHDHAAASGTDSLRL